MRFHLLVTAALLRDLRVVDVLGGNCANCGLALIFRFLPHITETGGRSSRRRSGFHQKFDGIDCGVGAAASSSKARILMVLNPRVNENCVFLARGESLIF